MSEDLSNRRRAVYTGLKPYLPHAMLEQALEHWEQHHARAPRFALQRFVHEVCQLADLWERRADIHLNLVQAMNMPVESLLDDAPVRKNRNNPDAATPEQHHAFEQLMNRILHQLDNQADQQLRLDLLASLRREQFPERVLHQLQRWLLDGEGLAADHAPSEALRAIINRAYVLLAQYRGPGIADEMLQRATQAVRREHPEWTDALARLL